MKAPEAEKLDLRALRDKASKVDKPKEDPLINREETFRVVYHAPDGRVHESALVSRIMTGDERHVVTRMCALMANGIPFPNLPLGDQTRFYALAVCSIQLRDAPAWVDRWISEDSALLNGIYGQLEGHDLRYFRRGVQEGGESTEISRVEIDPIKPAAGSS